MILFIFIGVCFLTAYMIAVRPMKMAVKIPLLVLVFVLTYLGYEYLSLGSKGDDPFAPWYNESPGKHVILFIFLLLGMIINYLFEYLQKRAQIKEHNYKELQKPDGEQNLLPMPKFMWEKVAIPLAISFLVFSYVVKEFEDAEMSIVLIASSFQNGFFWPALMDKLKPK